MSKAKPKMQTVINQNTVIKNLDYDLLAEAIVKAQLSATEKEKAIESDKAKSAAAWHNALGIIDINPFWSPIKKWLCSIRNNVVGVWRLMWLHKDDIYKDTATAALLNAMTSWIIGLFKLLAYIVSVLLLINALRLIKTSEWLQVLCSVLIIIPLFLVGRLLRIVQFEVEKIQDSQYLIGLLSALLAIIALVVSLVAWLYPR